MMRKGAQGKLMSSGTPLKAWTMPTYQPEERGPRQAPRGSEAVSCQAKDRNYSFQPDSHPSEGSAAAQKQGQETSASPAPPGQWCLPALPSPPRSYPHWLAEAQVTCWGGKPCSPFQWLSCPQPSKPDPSGQTT